MTWCSKWFRSRPRTWRIARVSAARVGKNGHAPAHWPSANPSVELPDDLDEPAGSSRSPTAARFCCVATSDAVWLRTGGDVFDRLRSSLRGTRRSVKGRLVRMHVLPGAFLRLVIQPSVVHSHKSEGGQT
jgi:hypothetical protein